MRELAVSESLVARLHLGRWNSAHLIMMLKAHLHIVGQIKDVAWQSVSFPTLYHHDEGTDIAQNGHAELSRENASLLDLSFLEDRFTTGTGSSGSPRPEFNHDSFTPLDTISNLALWVCSRRLSLPTPSHLHFLSFQVRPRSSSPLGGFTTLSVQPPARTKGPERRPHERSRRSDMPCPFWDWGKSHHTSHVVSCHFWHGKGRMSQVSAASLSRATTLQLAVDFATANVNVTRNEFKLARNNRKRRCDKRE